MLLQSSYTFDPEQVLQQVWQGDYPSTWLVFFGPIISALNCLLGIVVVMMILVTTFIIFIGVTGVIEGIYSLIARSTFNTIADAIVVIMAVLISIGLIVLIRRTIRAAAAKGRASRKPRSTIVVMPEGAVAYHRKQIRSIAFAHIAQMRLRVQARSNTITSYDTATNTPITTTVPAAPSIWLDLVFHDSQRGVWRIDIAPQDAIAQSTIEAYTRYRVQH